MKKLGVVVLMVCIALLLVLVSCTKKECETVADCAEQPGKTVKCDEGKCVYSSISCSKSVKITVKDKEQIAKYLTRELDNQTKKCVIRVNDKDLHQERIVDEKQLPFFKLSTILSYPQPFVKSADEFTFEFQLKDTHRDFVGPVMITNLRILDKDTLIADQEVSVRLEIIGDKVRVAIPLTYDIDPEEERSLSFKIDYAHEVKVKEGTQTQRKDYVGSFKRKVVLVDPTQAER